VISPLSSSKMRELLVELLEPPTLEESFIAPGCESNRVASENTAAVDRILARVDLAPLTRGRRGEAPIAMTPAALRAFINEHGEYSCSFPSLTTIGKKWARDENGYPRTVRHRPPEWWICEYVELSPPDPSRVAISRRRVKLLGDLGTLQSLILVKRVRRAVVRFRSRSAAWLTRSSIAPLTPTPEASDA
jgi:hypothetical protein